MLFPDQTYPFKIDHTLFNLIIPTTTSTYGAHL